MSVKNNSTLLTHTDLDDIFSGFSKEKDRIKYMSKGYADMDIAEAFSKFYDVQLTSGENEEFTNTAVSSIKVGNCYAGTVTSIGKKGISFSMPGIKTDIISKENFNDCIDTLRNYLLNHNNTLYFEVIEQKRDSYVVSVINGYYKLWKESETRNLT